MQLRLARFRLEMRLAWLRLGLRLSRQRGIRSKLAD
jgi:hypothetical protein